MTHPSKPPGELVHYGVKGMKWGVRRNKQINSGYTSYNQKADKKIVGNRGVKRISRRMDKGQNYNTARKSVIRNRAMRRLAVSGALILGPELAKVADMTRGSIAQRAQTKRGQAAAAEALGLGRKPSKGPNYAKRRRDGSYKISSV
ncbi:hypothetical protein SEA_LIBERTYBELL_8 [Streptomyces phage LibertyBell]|nr:hypothetical protein SEA_LIBERTYBELL_8 [Streptomyces phage LibertyBell]